MSKKFRIKPVGIFLSEGKAPKEIQLLRCGNFNHPCYGHFSITTEFLEQMVSNFELNVRGVDLMIDYNHECGDAAGWIKSLEIKNKGNELWASVDWTEQGQTDLIGKKYRYLSADFDEKYVDLEANQNYGPTLFGAALTNRPFVKNMAPVVELTETHRGENMKSELEKLQAENKHLTEEFSDLGKKNKELQEQVAQFKAEVKSLKSEKELSEKKATFSKLLSEGKAVKAQEEAFLKGDTIKFAELAGSLNLEAKGHGKDPENAEKSPENEVIRLAEQMVKDGKAKDIGEAQSKVLNEYPELRNKIYA